MIGGSGFNIRKVFLGILFVSGIAFSLYSQGTSIGGVINQYMQVTNISGPDNITLGSADIFTAGDTVLLIQMKGVVMNGIQDVSYGSYQYTLGSPGAYEFLIIASVNYPGKNITFTANIANTYDVSGLVQLIKVPSYGSATVTTELTCQPWDSLTTKSGGVLALIVGNTLTLKANINVTGKGFDGGIPTVGDSICIVNNVPLYDKSVYPVSYTNSGYKGEGLVSRAWLASDNIPPIYPDFMKGKGFSFTGGGGGNGKYAGGGGGANIGFGGKGGRESTTCIPNQGEGLAGSQILNTPLEGKMLMGSGGGSSTQKVGSSASAGGKGGGIIIIVCDTLTSAGTYSISANGATASAATSNAGAGGGGGAGTIALFQRSFSFVPASSALGIIAKGGNGGNAINGGEGGGGGGGLLLTNLSFPANITPTYTGGTKGTRTFGSLWSSNGNQGKILTTFTPLLNGFLFNIVRSAVSKNNIDSVCSNVRPPKIIGTKPIGGSGIYTYVWQKSYEATFSTPVILVNDADPVNYTPRLADASTPTGSVWFRRIVRDAGPPAINDTSKAVRIIVHTAISNNNVGYPDTICYNGNPPLIQQIMPDLIVPSAIYEIKWQDSSAAGTWSQLGANGKDYDPPALTSTTRYRRIVTSGSCADTSHIVEMKVLPLISNNLIMSPDQKICFGASFDTIKAAKPPLLTGGDGSYRFIWESNINNAGWTTATGQSTAVDYKPVAEPTEKAPANEYYYHRIVLSGSNDVCADTSAEVHFRDFHTISGNDIGPDNQLYCAGTVPIRITGLQPNYGDGNFTYTWQSRKISQTKWENIAGYVNVTDNEYQPPALYDTTFFRRIAFSTCVDSTNSIRINIHPAIIGNSVSLSSGSGDTTICNGQAPAGFIGTVPSGGIGNFTYQWLFSGSGPSNYVPAEDAIMPDYPDPDTLFQTTYYKRQVSSGACIDTSGARIAVTVLPPVSANNISAVQAICANTAPPQITGSSPAGGSGSYLYLWEQSSDGSLWVNASGANTSGNYQPPVLSQETWYRRTVASGPQDCCSNLSNEVTIAINPAPVGPVNAGSDTTIFSMGKTSYLNADPPVISGESGFWTALEPGSASIDDVSDSKTEVRHLTPGKNYFLWTITNGLCNIEDSVYIDLLPDFIPQGFSPNGDAFNNTFIIEGLNLSDQQVGELTILNGAGSVVYSTSNMGGREWVDWQGKNNSGNELPEGTYYYLLKLITQDKQLIRKSGFVVLKRY